MFLVAGPSSRTQWNVNAKASLSMACLQPTGVNGGLSSRAGKSPCGLGTIGTERFWRCFQRRARNKTRSVADGDTVNTLALLRWVGEVQSRLKFFTHSEIVRKFCDTNNLLRSYFWGNVSTPGVLIQEPPLGWTPRSGHGVSLLPDMPVGWAFCSCGSFTLTHYFRAAVHELLQKVEAYSISKANCHDFVACFIRKFLPSSPFLKLIEGNNWGPYAAWMGMRVLPATSKHWSGHLNEV